MSHTLTYGLVAVTEINGHQTTNVLKEVSGTWGEESVFVCTLCSQEMTDEEVYRVYIFQCPDCGDREEDSYDTTKTCESCRSYDDEDDEEGTPVEMKRTDGVDGTVEYRGCSSCTGGPLIETTRPVLICGECGLSFPSDETDPTPEEHLYQHLNRGWE